MKTLMLILVLVIIAIGGCTKPKETCIPVNLKIDKLGFLSKYSYSYNGEQKNITVYLEQIGTFENQAAIDAYPHLAGAQIGDIIYNDRNSNGMIEQGDSCK